MLLNKWWPELIIIARKIPKGRNVLTHTEMNYYNYFLVETDDDFNAQFDFSVSLSGKIMCYHSNISQLHSLAIDFTHNAVIAGE